MQPNRTDPDPNAAMLAAFQQLPPAWQSAFRRLIVGLTADPTLDLTGPVTIHTQIETPVGTANETPAAYLIAQRSSVA
ncbi:MAG: hypothetical protein NTZ05_09115 [Chloroflexi bacterium]|nr:hypothetical protein [Chloroflexota bacterium]